MVATAEMWSPEPDNFRQHSNHASIINSSVDISYIPNKAYIYYNLPKWFNQFTSNHRRVLQQDVPTTLQKDTTSISKKCRCTQIL